MSANLPCPTAPLGPKVGRTPRSARDPLVPPPLCPTGRKTRHPPFQPEPLQFLSSDHKVSHLCGLPAPWRLCALCLLRALRL